MDYQVEQLHRCTIIRGEVPVNDLVALMTNQHEGAVMDANLASRFGAMMIYGMPSDLAELAKHAPSRSTDYPGAEGLSAGARDWLAVGEHGQSSRAMFQQLTGVAILAGRDRADAHPHDPDDLRRCRLFLEADPQLTSRLGQMASLSPQWAALVDHWTDLCMLMDSEAPEWRTKAGQAPATLKLMSQLLQPPTKAARPV